MDRQNVVYQIYDINETKANLFYIKLIIDEPINKINDKNANLRLLMTNPFETTLKFSIFVL